MQLLITLLLTLVMVIPAVAADRRYRDNRRSIPYKIDPQVLQDHQAQFGNSTKVYRPSQVTTTPVSPKPVVDYVFEFPKLPNFPENSLYHIRSFALGELAPKKKYKWGR